MYICMLESIQMRGTLCMTFRVSVNVSSNSYEKSKCVFVRVLMPKKFRRWETLTWNKDPQRQRGHCCFPAGQTGSFIQNCCRNQLIFLFVCMPGKFRQVCELSVALMVTVYEYFCCFFFPYLSVWLTFLPSHRQNGTGCSGKIFFAVFLALLSQHFCQQ